MILLLDTCTFLWMDVDAPELSSRAREIFRDPRNELFLSAASVWEIALKYGLKRLQLPEPPERYIPSTREKYGIHFFPIDEISALGISRLPGLHKDPFDRMIVSQAVAHGLTVLTPDEWIRSYAVRTEW